MAAYHHHDRRHAGSDTLPEGRHLRLLTGRDVPAHPAPQTPARPEPGTDLDPELFDAIRRWFQLCAEYTVALANGDGGRAEAIQLRLTANRRRIDGLIESHDHLRRLPHGR
ncbi:MAG TPA: hypothetical protein VGC11_13325 [Acidimicrobiia bacterium]|jgi:hypothetical protein